jgi:cytochrome b561
MNAPRIRELIWLQAFARLAAYPIAIVIAVWVISKVAHRNAAIFWDVEGPGGVMLCASVAILVMACLRLAEGRLETPKGRTLRRSGDYAARLWLMVFAATAALLIVLGLLGRIAAPLPLPWMPATVTPAAPQTASSDDLRKAPAQ